MSRRFDLIASAPVSRTPCKPYSVSAFYRLEEGSFSLRLIPVAGERVAQSVDEAMNAAGSLGYPVVLKVEVIRPAAQDRRRRGAAQPEQRR